MLGQHRDVRVRADAAQLVEVAAEALGLPAHAALQRREIHALHHRQVAQHRLALRRGTGRDAEAAIADHRGVVTPSAGDGDSVRSHVACAS